MAFFTKANATLQMHNRELEHMLLVARQRLQEMGLSTTPDVRATETDNNQDVKVNIAESKVQPVSVGLCDQTSAQAGEDAKQKSGLEVVSTMKMSAFPSLATVQVPSLSVPGDNESDDEYIEALRQVRQ
jgi:hypothetical protein